VEERCRQSGVYADSGNEVQRRRARDGGGIFGQTGRSILSEFSDEPCRIPLRFVLEGATENGP
jgi:hypothetical protein